MEFEDLPNVRVGTHVLDVVRPEYAVLQGVVGLNEVVQEERVFDGVDYGVLGFTCKKWSSEQRHETVSPRKTATKKC